MNFFSRLIAILLAALTFPLRILGFGPGPGSAQALAVEALADAEPAPANDERPRSTFEGADLGHLVKDHAGARLGQRAAGMPALDPLPFWLQHWFDGLDEVRLRKVASASIPGWLLQKHLLAGTSGTLPSLGYVTPAPKGSGNGGTAGGKEGKSGGGVKPATLDEVLEEMGYAPARTMRMR